MNSYFSKVIVAGGKQREFNFKQLTHGDDSRYYVDVDDDKGVRVMFSMYRDANGRWRTSAQRLPIWIHNLELVLGSAIEEYVKETGRLIK